MIYVQFGDEAPFRFRSVSNFSIEIIQHMNDEKFPKKLVRVRNIHKHESVFDMASEAINTPNSFENAITNYGNYQWRGKREDHQLLKSYLFDGMGTGRQVEVLGWQPEGFWVWNNLVITEEGEKLDIDRMGVSTIKGLLITHLQPILYFPVTIINMMRKSVLLALIPKLHFSISPSEHSMYTAVMALWEFYLGSLPYFKT